MVISSAETSEVNNGSAKSNSAVIFGIADSLDRIANFHDKPTLSGTCRRLPPRISSRFFGSTCRCEDASAVGCVAGMGLYLLNVVSYISFGKSLRQVLMRHF